VDFWLLDSIILNEIEREPYLLPELKSTYYVNISLEMVQTYMNVIYCCQILQVPELN
jgi:hypothetical protein